MSVLPPLAQPSDVAARLGQPVPTDSVVLAQINARLADASSVVRGFCKRTFTQMQTTQVLRPTGSTVKIPDRPVISVDSIYLIGYAQQLIPLPTFLWDGADEVWLGYGPNDQIINVPESLTDLWLYRTPLVKLTWTHGYAVMPDDIVAITAGMVVRAMSTPNGGVISGQTAGEFSYRLSPHAATGPLALTDAERDVLKSYRRSGRSTEARFL